MGTSVNARRPGLAAATAAATAVAGLAAPAAHAAATTAQPGRVAYECQIFSTRFAYDATVTVRAPATAKVGDRVTVEADFSDLPGVAPLPINKWRTGGALTVAGAQSGSVPIAVPERQGPIPARVPIPVGTATGELTLTRAGDVTLAPAALRIVADAGAEATIDCAPKGDPAVLGTVKVTDGGGGEPPGPDVTVTPATVKRGAGLTVGGTGWKPGAAALALCDANGADCKPGDLTDATASADAGGRLAGSAKVAGEAAPGARTLAVTQGTVTRRTAVTVTADTPPPTGGCAGKPGDRCGEQTLKVTVNGGPLTMSQKPGEVALTPVTLDGTERSATGELREVEVVDARGGTAGWSLTGVLTDFTSPNGTRIPAGRLTWKPSCAARDGATPVTPGSAGPLDTATAATLCGGPGGSTVVGGTHTAGAGLDLKVPPATGAGRYTAVLTLTLS
ncbi:Ig-like domain-containing protein [Actinomadura kijaniata]|uniref:Beta-xylosidase n=1 Tax=Actinomadura namibiensis TaxID=182080 RepID=A0A7W3LYW3_ACTNM|nr:hypothetical protein [Actinomadura namibiensis]MBA8956866.1 hypothetical protein [Actinomadura namibiensis]